MKKGEQIFPIRSGILPVKSTKEFCSCGVSYVGETIWRVETC